MPHGKQARQLIELVSTTISLLMALCLSRQQCLYFAARQTGHQCEARSAWGSTLLS
jgi:hypothetical protein